MKMSREESIKKIFDMGFNGNVSSIIDYDVIDYDDGTQLGIEACEQIYEQYSDFCYNFNGFVEEFREDKNALAKFKKGIHNIRIWSNSTTSGIWKNSTCKILQVMQ